MSVVKKDKLYKNRYYISFYELDDDTLMYCFNNIREICLFRKIEPTKENLHSLVSELYCALKRTPHITSMLTGKQDAIVYLIDDKEDMN